MATLPFTRAADHVAAFYQTDDFLLDRIAWFVSDGLAAGDQVIVVATLAHWNAVAERLERHNLSYGRAAAEGRLVLLDAEEVLDGIMVEGRPSPERFRAALQSLIKKDTRQRIYGELVSLLAQRGDLDTALTIESLGHQLAHTHGIPVLCGYQAAGSKPLSGVDISRVESVHDRSLFEGKAEGQGADREAQSRFHAVRFYENRESLARIVGQFLGEGFVAGLPAIVIATPDHRESIKDVLESHYFDLKRLEAAGDLIMADAGSELARFMRNGMPDPMQFRQAMIPLIEQASRGRQHCVIRAYGEMVDVLWKAGESTAAIRLEMLWNELANTHSFSLLCGYSMGHFYKDTGQHDICRQHTHQITDSGDRITLQ